MPGYETANLTERELARIVKTAVSPRPIAWVSTVSEDGYDNLAPFSSYNYVGSGQPVVVFNTANTSVGELKDTAKNAIETGEFAVNVVTREFLEKMDRTAASLSPAESEFTFADVERAECESISAPRVKDAPVTMECTLHDTVKVHDRLMILGDVQYFHIDESAMTDGKIDSNNLDTVGRLGGPYYTVSEPIEFERQY